MRELAGKTAFVTGGAAGIGLALGWAFAQAGMKVMLADIETDALQAAVKSLQEISPDIRGTICDVADAQSVELDRRAFLVAVGIHEPVAGLRARSARIRLLRTSDRLQQHAKAGAESCLQYNAPIAAHA